MFPYFPISSIKQVEMKHKQQTNLYMLIHSFSRSRIERERSRFIRACHCKWMRLKTSPSACLHYTTPDVHVISSAIFSEFNAAPGREALRFCLVSSALHVLFLCCARTLNLHRLVNTALQEYVSCRVYTDVRAAWSVLHLTYSSSCYCVH